MSQTIAGYPVDYDWAATHARLDDYCLVGELRGDQAGDAVEAVRAVLRGCEQYPAQVDGESFVAAVDGGVRARVVGVADSAGLDIEIYSSGEDAADAISEFTEHLAEEVRRVASSEVSLTWSPLRADREDRHFSFEPA